MQDKDILKFWKWFTDNRGKLESGSYDPSFLQKLDKTVSKWKLNWEIGPGISKTNSITISPKGDIELLPVTQRVIAKAPNMLDWEFYSTKQAKQNWFLLELPNDNISVDASDWEYVLLQYEDGKVEVLIKAATLTKFDKNTKELIVDIILTNLLGEKMFMERVDYFDIVEDFESDSGISELKYLPKHLQDESFFTK